MTAKKIGKTRPPASVKTQEVDADQEPVRWWMEPTERLCSPPYFGQMTSLLGGSLTLHAPPPPGSHSKEKGKPFVLSL